MKITFKREAKMAELVSQAYDEDLVVAESALMWDLNEALNHVMKNVWHSIQFGEVCKRVGKRLGRELASDERSILNGLASSAFSDRLRMP